jgi:16S rRNA (guanine966-N2)-methyltransferase
VVVGAAGTVLARPAEQAFDVLLADPPYSVTDDEVAGWLATALAGGWLAGEAVVVVERARSRSAFPWPDGFAPARDRRYGDTVLRTAHAPG